jgi:hypothetical protein
MGFSSQPPRFGLAFGQLGEGAVAFFLHLVEERGQAGDVS